MLIIFTIKSISYFHLDTSTFPVDLVISDVMKSLLKKRLVLVLIDWDQVILRKSYLLQKGIGQLESFILRLAEKKWIRQVTKYILLSRAELCLK